MALKLPNNFKDLRRDFMTAGFVDDTKTRLLTRVYVLNLFDAIGSATMAMYGFVNMMTGKTLLGVFEIGASVMFLVALLLLRHTKNYELITSFSLAVFSVAVSIVYITGGYLNAGIMALFLFPPVVFFLIGRRKGSYWIGFFLALMIFSAGLDYAGYIITPYEPIFILQTTALMLVLSSLVYVFARVNDRYFELVEEQTAKLITAQAVADKRRIMAMEQKEHLDTILASIGDGVVVVDTDFKILHVNPMVEKLAGYTESELLGTMIGEKIHFVNEYTNKMEHDFIKGVFEHGKIASMPKDTVLITADDSKLPIADSAAPIHDENGDVVECVIVFRDATKEREIDRMKSEFVSMASHQLKTPLTGIKWYLEMFSGNSDNLSDEQLSSLKEIESINDKTISLVNDLLDVSRIDRGKKFDIEPEVLDIVPVLKKAVSDHSVSAQEKNVSVTIDTSIPSELPVQADEKKITHAFLNLISNAIKYTPEKGSVSVGVKIVDDFAEFYVKDTGIGIPKKQQDSMFDRFFRADNAVESGAEGTGLGLYIVKAIVEGHGGKIWFDSEEGKGTTFYITIPLAGNNGSVS